MLFPGTLDERAVSQNRKRRVAPGTPENRPACTTTSYHSAHALNSTANSAMKPHRYERSVIEQCPDCGRLFTDRHPDCPDEDTTTNENPDLDQ